VFATVYACAVLTSGREDVLDAAIRLVWLLTAAPLLVLARVFDPAHLSLRTRLTA
jgi:hypothetical protein